LARSSRCTCRGRPGCCRHKRGFSARTGTSSRRELIGTALQLRLLSATPYLGFRAAYRHRRHSPLSTLAGVLGVVRQVRPTRRSSCALPAMPPQSARLARSPSSQQRTSGARQGVRECRRHPAGTGRPRAGSLIWGRERSVARRASLSWAEVTYKVFTLVPVLIHSRLRHSYPTPGLCGPHQAAERACDLYRNERGRSNPPAVGILDVLHEVVFRSMNISTHTTTSRPDTSVLNSTSGSAGSECAMLLTTSASSVALSSVDLQVQVEPDGVG
jgi:hypothetical protein